ncbi:hypothetical protein BT96DRAFT_1000940 [Gymnopus androsaceus JB14]|uniref:Uncharacterized protein n=1 Tax=Gymnopus androsaceus JB14 TaxID=1447944 RepID=A0A6A4H192_9AGAR|nr:hypothetical protein BT96DRAFT_1000940 [Gymnopus androsaceus JB14]
MADNLQPCASGLLSVLSSDSLGYEERVAPRGTTGSSSLSRAPHARSSPLNSSSVLVCLVSPEMLEDEDLSLFYESMSSEDLEDKQDSLEFEDEPYYSDHSRGQPRPSEETLGSFKSEFLKFYARAWVAGIRATPTITKDSLRIGSQKGGRKSSSMLWWEKFLGEAQGEKSTNRKGSGE